MVLSVIRLKEMHFKITILFTHSEGYSSVFLFIFCWIYNGCIVDRGGEQVGARTITGSPLDRGDQKKQGKGGGLHHTSFIKVFCICIMYLLFILYLHLYYVFIICNCIMQNPIVCVTLNFLMASKSQNIDKSSQR